MNVTINCPINNTYINTFINTGIYTIIYSIFHNQLAFCAFQYNGAVLTILCFHCHAIKGSKGGAVVRALASHQCGPGSNPGVDAICGLSLLLVLSLAPRGFSPGTPVFPSPQNQHFQIPIRSGTYGHV